MHPRQASLLNKAAALSRRIYASLPWFYRVADVVAKLAAADPRADFGRLVYTIFIRAKVRGLPDIGGKDALSIDVSGDKLAPPGYGRDFGNQMWARMLKKYRDPELVSDAMQETALKLLAADEPIDEGTPLRTAEGKVLTMLGNVIKDVLKSSAYRLSEGLEGEGDDDDRPKRQLTDKAVRGLHLSLKDWQRIMDRVRREVHPDAGLYLDLFLQGYEAKEIVGDKASGIPSMLPHVQQRPMSYQNWDGNIKPKIYSIIREELTA